MTQRFLIRHPDGREYELSDVAYFQTEYEPLGFAIVDPAPTGYTVPEVPKAAKPKAEPKSVKKPAETPTEAEA